MRRSARPAGLARPPWWPSVAGAGRPSVLELVGPPSCGKLSLALLWLAEVREDGLIAILDETGRFYPPSAWACGIAPERLVVLRPPDSRAALGAAALLLGSAGFDAVLWPLGPKTRPSGADGARLARLAGRSGTTLLALETRGRTRSPLDPRLSSLVPADVRLRVVEWAWAWRDGELGGARLRVRTERLHGAAPGRDWELVLARGCDGGSSDRLRLDAAFPVGGRRTRAADDGADRDLPSERAYAGAS